MSERSEATKNLVLILITVFIIAIGPVMIESVSGNYKGEAVSVVSAQSDEFLLNSVRNSERKICVSSCECSFGYCQESSLHLGKIYLRQGDKIIGSDENGRYFLSKHVLYNFLIEADNSGEKFYVKMVTKPNVVYDSKGLSENDKYYSRGTGKLQEIKGEYGIMINRLDRSLEYPFYFSLAENGEFVKFLYLEDDSGELSQVISIPIVVV